VQALAAVRVGGLLGSVILWIGGNPDVGALVLAVVFAVGAALMIIRQALLAERI
jgi:cytochrome c biogenesis protein CcdA